MPWKQCPCPQWDEDFIIRGGGAVEGYEARHAVAEEMPRPHHVANDEPFEAVAEAVNRPRPIDRARFLDLELGDEDDSDGDLDLGDDQPGFYEFLARAREMVAAGDFTDDEEIDPNDIYDLPDRVEEYNEVDFEEGAEQDEEIMSERAGYSDSEGDEESGDIGVEYGEEVQLEEIRNNLDEDEEGSSHNLYDNEDLENHEFACSDDPEDDAVVCEGFSEQQGFAEVEPEEEEEMEEEMEEEEEEEEEEEVEPEEEMEMEEEQEEVEPEELEVEEEEVETGYCEVEENEDYKEQDIHGDADREHNDCEELDGNEPDGYLESNDHDSDILNYYDEPDHYEPDYDDGVDGLPDLYEPDYDDGPDDYDEPDHYDDEPDIDHYDDEQDYYYDNEPDNYDEYD